MDAIPTVRLVPGMAPAAARLALAPAPSGPLVSCLMVTRGAAFPAAIAIDCYRRQSYANRELVIVCDEPGSAVEALAARLDDPTIRCISTAPATLGELRNVSVAHARGALLCQWDDDDLHDPERIALQVGALAAHGDAAVFLERWLIWWPAQRRLAISGRRAWEGTMLVRRDALPAYPALALGEDQAAVARLRAVRPVLLIDRPAAYCYVVHGRNSYDPPHFEEMLGWASWTAAAERYEADLAALEARLPVRDYAAGLAQHAAAAA